MKLYTSILCPYAHRVRITLAEKGLDPEQIEVDPRNKPAELAALSPFGKVPVLSVQGRMISESAVICEFLDEIFKPPALLPPEPLQRAEARLWIRFADTRLYPHTQQLLYAAPAAERPRLIRELQEDLRSLDDFLSRHEGPYFLGEKFSLVDATLLPWFEQCIVIEQFRAFTWPENLFALRRWHARVSDRPSVRAVGQSPIFYERAYGALISIPVLTAASH